MSSLHGDRSDGSVAVVVVAAGKGQRFGGALPKALELIAGRTLLAHTLERICSVEQVSQVVVAAPVDFVAEVQALCSEALGPDRASAREHASRVGANPNEITVSVVSGGKERADSVAAALEAIRDDVEVVLVHDAARAFAPADLFAQVINSVRAGHVAVVPALPVTDTIKDVDEREIVARTVPRHSLRAVQTPQGFTKAVLFAAHGKQTSGAQGSPTDDAGMVEADGHDVLIVTGSPSAFKITNPFDRLVAQALVAQREEANEQS